MNALIYILIFKIDGFMHINSEFLEIIQILVLDLVTKMVNIESNRTFQNNKTQKQTSNGSRAAR